MPIKPFWLEEVQESVRKNKSNPRDQNTDEENNLLDRAMERFEASYSNKTGRDNKHLHRTWANYDKIYGGEQWQGSVPAGKSKPVMNYTKRLVEAQLDRILANSPQVQVKPMRDVNSEELSDMLTAIQGYLYYTQDMDVQLENHSRVALKYGTSIYKTIWDPAALNGMGEVAYTQVHPMNFFNDNRAYRIDQMDHCFVKVPRSIESLVRRWPEKGKWVLPNSDYGGTDTEELQNVGNYSPEQTSSLVEYWFRDEENRVCVMYYANGVVLDIFGGEHDGTQQPVYRHNEFPFAAQYDYPEDKRFWGAGEIELVEMINRLVNSFEAQIIDNTRLMANAEWIVNKAESGLREEDSWVFNSRPGNVIFTQRGGVDRVEGTPIPSHIPEHSRELVNAMEYITGVHDIVQGRRPTGVRSASAIIALQESANVTTKKKAERMAQALRRSAHQANYLALQYYDEPRKIRVGGDSVPVTLDVQQALTRNLTQRAKETGMMVPDAAPQELAPEQESELREEFHFPEFDTRVIVGPGIPKSEAILYEQAKEFFQLGAIDRRALLEATNFPNWEEIIQRVEGGQRAQQEERTGERGFGGKPEPRGAGQVLNAPAAGR